MWRYLPLAGVVLLLSIACCLRPLLQLRRHGSFGIFLFNSRGLTQNLRDFLLILLAILLLGQAMVAAAHPPPAALLVTASGLAHEILQVTGAIVMFCGIGLVAVAQLHLGASWRIGIDASTQPGLVTDGLYRCSRNPIYLGLLMTVAGYAALLPTWLSIGLLIGAYLGVRAQTTAEEAYLLKTYGDTYRDYARRVGRFVPWLGKNT